MQNRRSQTAYENPRASASVDLDERIATAMFEYIRDDLGLSEEIAGARTIAETSGSMGRTLCDECEAAGLTLPGKRVLDLGAGLGGLSAELARRGANVVAIEPGAAWRKLASERVAAAGRGIVIGATGESLPIRDNSIDLIVSFQVLEHVHDPGQVVREAFRVLKPGGHFFMTYENYLSFWEPHYRVRWLPLLPKALGSLYLKSMGRNPRFLQEAVTYTTFPAVRSSFLKAGFECKRILGFRESLRSPLKTGAKWKFLKQIASVHEPTAMSLLATADYANRMMRTGVHEFMQKPDPSAHLEAKR